MLHNTKLELDKIENIIRIVQDKIGDEKVIYKE